MKAYKLIPILAIALLVPSLVQAKQSHRGKRGHYVERTHQHGPPSWAPAYGYRAKHGHYRRDDYRRHHRRDTHHRDTHRRDTHRRDRRGVHIGGVIVISF